MQSFVKCLLVLVALLASGCAATNFWYANVDHTGSPRGYAPEVSPYTYPVFQAVQPSQGGSGIQNAINSDGNGGTRPGQWLSAEPRVVYLASGTYSVSSTIYLKTDTIIIGDATNPPILKAAAGFSGSTLISGQDPATGQSGELSFAVGLKNLILDTTSIAGGNAFTALYWGVAQAAQLQNIRIVMATSSNGNGHSGIVLGRGSTLGLSDVRVERGQNGIWHNGHQQAEFKNIYFYQNTVGLLISGGNTISVFSPIFDTCGTAVLNNGGSPWIALVDAESINSGATFVTTVYPSFLIENLHKDTSSPIAQVGGATVLGSASYVAQFTYGNIYGANPIYGALTSTLSRPSALIWSNGSYPAVPAPTYADKLVSDFINIKDPNQNGGHTVLGDSTVDESGVLNQVFQYIKGQGKIAYVPFGLYRLDSTLVIPIGVSVVGEAWATFTGNGNYFKDSSNPKPVVQVGNPGDVGTSQLQDLRFTVSDVLPGAIILQFNAAGSSPGQVGIWNSLVTVGGTKGASALTNACGNAGSECKGAFTGIHFTSSSSAYLENVWNWVADHITEDFSGGSNIAGKVGVLVQATKGTWIHALGSEHWWLAQFNLFQASNVMVALLQSETNYDQGDHTQQIPPAPWTANVAGWGDPDFSWCGGSDARCRMGYANFINGGSNLRLYASASWAFFSGPGYQGCAGTFQCQNVMHWIQTQPTNLQAFGLCSKDSYATLRLANGVQVQTSAGFTGSWPGGGGDIARYTC